MLPFGDFVRLRHDRSVHAVTTFPRRRLPSSVEFINKASMCARRERGVRACRERTVRAVIARERMRAGVASSIQKIQARIAPLFRC